MVSAIKRFLGVYLWMVAGCVAVFGMLILAYAADQFWRARQLTGSTSPGDLVLQDHYRTVASYVAVIALVYSLVCSALIMLAVKIKWRGTPPI